MFRPSRKMEAEARREAAHAAQEQERRAARQRWKEEGMTTIKGAAGLRAVVEALARKTWAQTMARPEGEGAPERIPSRRLPREPPDVGAAAREEEPPKEREAGEPRRPRRAELEAAIRAEGIRHVQALARRATRDYDHVRRREPEASGADQERERAEQREKEALRTRWEAFEAARRTSERGPQRQEARVAQADLVA